MAMIRSARELQNNYHALAKLAHETNQPIHITNNGQDDTVIMSEAAYECLCNKAYIDYKLLEAEFRDDTPVDASKSLQKIRKRLKARIQSPRD